MNTKRQLDRLEVMALAYLLLPLVVFMLAWLSWSAACFLGALLLLTSRAALVPSLGLRSEAIPVRVFVLMAGMAAAWVFSSGLAGGLPLNADWQVRMTVLRDLTVGEWPVGYGSAKNGGEYVLRFSMAFYLVPAALGKAFGVEAARYALGLWTYCGVLLFFALALGSRLGARVIPAAATLAVLIVFSGMDIVGWFWTRDQLPDVGQHIEWWDPFMQYSSNTTLLYWAPNHALPGWLAATVLWRHRATGLVWPAAALLLLSACLWSPLMVIGLAPLLLCATFVGSTPTAWLKGAFSPSVLAVLPGVLVLAAFCTFGVPQNVIDLAGEQTQLQIGMAPTLLPLLLRFAMVEWGLFGLILWRSHARSYLFWVAVVQLFLLPLLRFGPGNDVVMRGGIVPLTILALACAETLLAAETPWLKRLLLSLVLAIGCCTPWQELQREFLPGSRWPDQGTSLFDQQHAGSWHYIGVLRSGLMTRILREPVLLKPAADPR